jgi:hypothetical protein
MSRALAGAAALLAARWLLTGTCRKRTGKP